MIILFIQIGAKRIKQPTDIEIEILKSKVDSLEIRLRWLEKNWVDWTSSTKNIGQKIVIALDQIVNKEDKTL